ncbi:acyl-CoA N-acyltransferase [Ephemerocybe angulata]|uniref:Acyl-CoA N-acyltransferase n=1 Tax=Ephemerocybe angulata TaxID=980116 RepID=A0A8H6LZY7_9AGAR|nr:acyl-CoA N-acyltransferase [Tulosesus angulatus]
MATSTDTANTNGWADGKADVNGRLDAISKHLAAERLVLVLPDGGRVTTAKGGESNTTKGGERGTILVDGVAVAEYAVDRERTFALDITAVGTPFEGRTTHVPRYPLVVLSVPSAASSLSPPPSSAASSTTSPSSAASLTTSPAAPSPTTTSPAAMKLEDVWVALYALFTMYHAQEQVPLSVGALENWEAVVEYLLASGLARTHPSLSSASTATSSTTSSLPSSTTSSFPPTTKQANEIYFVSRAAFWQAAGTAGFHPRLNWLLQKSVPPPFPSVPSFTRNEKVIAKHPLRARKPAPGQVLYRRWCAAVGQMLELVCFDLEGVMDAPGEFVEVDEEEEGEGGKGKGGGKRKVRLSKHLAAFHKWHNDPRVAAAWGEAGSVAKHRAYIEGQYRDEHSVPCIFNWDGEMMGYVEVNWTREDHVREHFPEDLGVGMWDRGIHVLVGERRFLGAVRSEIWMRSLCHYIFLNDPRTNRVVGEPDHGNPAILRLVDDSGFYKPNTFDFPYKRSTLVLHPREKFFVQCNLY